MVSMRSYNLVFDNFSTPDVPCHLSKNNQTYKSYTFTRQPAIGYVCAQNMCCNLHIFIHAPFEKNSYQNGHISGKYAVLHSPPASSCLPWTRMAIVVCVHLCFYTVKHAIFIVLYATQMEIIFNSNALHHSWSNPTTRQPWTNNNTTLELAHVILCHS